EIAEKSTRAVTDDDHVRLGNLLQPRREIWRLANDATLLRLPPADEITDDDQPGRNSDTGLQGSARLELGHRFDQFEPRPYGSLGVVLMGPGIAEIHEGTVPHVSRHETIEAVRGASNVCLIGRNDLAQVLRVHAPGESRRPDEVREHHRDLPAFGGVGPQLRSGGEFGCRRDNGGKLTDGREYFSPMPE